MRWKTMKFFILTILLFASSPAVAAHKQPYGEKIAVTYVKFPLNAPLIVAKLKGMFEREFAKDRIRIEWVDINSGPKQAEALAEGRIHIASAISSDAVITARAQGGGVSAIGVFSRAPKAFCLMVKNPAIRSVADLKGKTVAGPEGAQLHLMFLAALKKAGLGTNDVRFVDMPMPQALSAMLSGGVDGAMAAGPGRSKAESEGARVLTTGEGLIKGLILIASSEKFLREHPDFIKRYLRIHSQALAYMKEKPDESISLIAAETGISHRDVRRMLPEYDFNPVVTEADVASLTEVKNFLVQIGRLREPIDLSKIFQEPE